MITQLVLQYQYAMARDAYKCAVGIETQKVWEDEIARLRSLGVELSDEIGEVAAIEEIILAHPRVSSYIIAKSIDADCERVKKIRDNLYNRLHGMPIAHRLDGDEEEDVFDAYFG